MESLVNTKAPPPPEIVLYCAYMMYHKCYHGAMKRGP